MKALVEISRRLRRETTVLARVEEALRKLVAARRSRGTFRLRDESFGGGGLQPGMREGDWEQVRDLIYEGRGS